MGCPQLIAGLSLKAVLPDFKYLNKKAQLKIKNVKKQDTCGTGTSDTVSTIRFRSYKGTMSFSTVHIILDCLDQTTTTHTHKGHAFQFTTILHQRKLLHCGFNAKSDLHSSSWATKIPPAWHTTLATIHESFASYSWISTSKNLSLIALTSGTVLWPIKLYYSKKKCLSVFPNII